MKKIIKLTVLVLSSLIVLVGVALLFFFSSLPVFNMVTALPEFPESMPVYGFSAPEITAEFVKDMGAKFGLTGEATLGKDGKYDMADQQQGHYLEVDTKAAVIRYYTDNLMKSTAAPLISNEEAAAIATDFLNGHGLLPEGITATSVLPAGRNGAMFAVYFDYPPGVHIDGVGGSFHASVGRGLEVVEVAFNARTYQPVEDAVLKPVRQAYEELKATGRKYSGISAQWIKIDSVTIAYWLDARSGQEYMYPVYVFTGRSGKYFDDASFPYTGRVEAIEGISIPFPVAS